ACTHTTANKDLKIERANAESVTATVEAIDMQTRMVTIRGPKGNSIIVHAGDEVVNLPQVRVGDEVVLVYVESVAVRMAEPGEVRDESSKEVSRATPGSKPGVVKVNETIVSATIEAIDKVKTTATLRMLDDSLRVVKVKDPTILEKVKVGDTIVITSTEAMALSVQKASK
ncbi:MAG: hypothetical protein Q8R88_15985, partial [Desulfoprunum sp.]|nr:hypothetical protein [Desulfoprunum sp.]